jgi:hypothetical protein
VRTFVRQDSILVVRRIINDTIGIVSHDRTGASLCHRLAVLPFIAPTRRLVASSSWNEWLVGVVVPPPAGDPPAYTRNLDIDLEPSGPSIDTYMKVGLPADETTKVLTAPSWDQT